MKHLLDEFCKDAAQPDKVLAYLQAATVPLVLAMVACVVAILFTMPWYLWLGFGLYGAWIWGAVYFGAKRHERR
jgi:hypothetical protein